MNIGLGAALRARFKLGAIAVVIRNLLTSSDLRDAVTYNTNGTTVTKGVLSNSKVGVVWTQNLTSEVAPVWLTASSIPVTDTKRYVLSFYTNTLAGAPGMKSQIQALGSTNYQLSTDGLSWITTASETPAPAPDGTGRRVIVLPALPVGITTIVIGNYVRTIASFQVELFDAQFEEGTVPTAFQPKP